MTNKGTEDMSVEQTRSYGMLRWRAVRMTGVSVLALGILSGCSSVPDALNPAEWYRDAADLIAGDDDTAATADPDSAQTDTTVPGEDEDFPDLASVPARSSVVTGDAVAEGLIADPNAPEYATAPARQTGDDELPPPPAPVADGSLQPAPPAQPTMPVQPAEVAAPSSTVTTATASTETAAMPTITLDQPAAAVPTSTPLVVEPGRLPSGETYEEYRARLMAGLDSHGSVPIMAPATINTQPQMAAAAAPDTVVVSAAGIDMTTTYTSGVSSTTFISESGFQQVGIQEGQPLLPDGVTKVATIHFSSGSSQLDVRDLQVLQKVAALQQQSGGTIRVIGHASSRTRSMDPVRHKMVNYNVSVARADTIAKQLVRLGASKGNIFVGAVSDTQPKFYEVMPSGEAGNRRAEIYIDS